MEMVLSQIVAFLLGIVGGIGACWAFWRLQLRVKPKVKVAGIAAYCEASKCLGVKVANLGSHQATDVEVRMAVSDRTREGRIITRLSGELNVATLFAIEPLDKLNEPWRLPTVFTFVALNGDKMLQCLRAERSDGADRRLLLTLRLQDGLSGTKLVKCVTFGPEKIKYGWYGPANSFDIFPEMTYEPSVETHYATIS